ncbi:MAG TPA: hypothetical protein VEB86_02300 [Chryseosolibacter sp.]|nr:hypothetical protein [Chryseosolibacter sp.]
MKNSKRNIPDPVSPQNPLNKTDITHDRIQEHLEDKTSVEDIFRDENELTKHSAQRLHRSQKANRSLPDDTSPADEAGV